MVLNPTWAGFGSTGRWWGCRWWGCQQQDGVEMAVPGVLVPGRGDASSRVVVPLVNCMVPGKAMASSPGLRLAGCPVKAAEPEVLLSRPGQAEGALMYWGSLLGHLVHHHLLLFLFGGMLSWREVSQIFGVPFPIWAAPVRRRCPAAVARGSEAPRAAHAALPPQVGPWG